MTARPTLCLLLLLPACTTCWPRGGVPGPCSVDDDTALDEDDTAADDDTADDDTISDDDTTADDDTSDDDTSPDPCLSFTAEPVESTRLGSPLRCISPGTFRMGAVAGDPDAGPDELPHDVEITGAFLIMETELTQGILLPLGQSNPSDCIYGCGDDLPVQNLDWDTATRLANALSATAGFTPAYSWPEVGAPPRWDRGADGYRLPTEAEWEYAARAGGEHLYAGSDDAGAVAVCARGGEAYHVDPVASLAPNAWGLHDMSGNASEWVWDAVSDYHTGPVSDPVTDPESPGDFVVGRGGGFPNGLAQCRVSDRSSTFSTTVYFHRGVRFVRRWP